MTVPIRMEAVDRILRRDCKILKCKYMIPINELCSILFSGFPQCHPVFT